MAKGLQDRGKANREMRRDILREELRSKEYLRQIHILLGKDYEDQISVGAAKMKLDGYFKLLAKTLPDVKSVEISGNEGGPIQFSEMSDDELKRVIAELAAESGIGLGSGGSE